MPVKPQIVRSVGHWLSVSAIATVLVTSTGAMAQTASTVAASRQAVGISPALCAAGDVREPGIQGEVPAGQTPNYNCGVKMIGQLPVSGSGAAVP